jgi:hypothetical protein
VAELKTANPDLKTLLLVGGPADFLTDLEYLSTSFSAVVNSTENMDLFVANVLADLRYDQLASLYSS